jgi:uridine phosphorylase
MDPELAIIEPRKGRREKALPPSAMMVFTPYDLEACVHCLHQHQEQPQRVYLTDLHTGTFRGTPVALAGPMLGAPQAVLVLEKLIVLGVQRIVAFGWCGSLQPHVKIGDVVLPSGAVSDEGTSQHYPLAAVRPGPAPELLNRLLQPFHGDQEGIHQGLVWSTDAPFRETVGKVLGYQQQGVLAVDMEVSALFTVAHFRDIRLAAVLAVSDELHDLTWRHGFKDRRFLNTRAKLAGIALEALCAG